MRWRLQFYNERRGLLARYSIEAPLPPAAVALGRDAVLAEYPPARARGTLSLFARAERLGGQDASGWVLYRIERAPRPAGDGSAEDDPDPMRPSVVGERDAEIARQGDAVDRHG
jgi:hypothetical protein